MEFLKDFMNLLDILSKRTMHKIWIGIYYKSDTHRCVTFSSNHPNHCKMNIPFTLANLICTIVENTEAKMKQLENLKMNLSKFKHPKQLI